MLFSLRILCQVSLVNLIINQKFSLSHSLSLTTHLCWALTSQKWRKAKRLCKIIVPHIEHCFMSLMSCNQNYLPITCDSPCQLSLFSSLLCVLVQQPLKTTTLRRQQKEDLIYDLSWRILRINNNDDKLNKFFFLWN